MFVVILFFLFSLWKFLFICNRGFDFFFMEWCVFDFGRNVGRNGVLVKGLLLFVEDFIKIVLFVEDFFFGNFFLKGVVVNGLFFLLILDGDMVGLSLIWGDIVLLLFFLWLLLLLCLWENFIFILLWKWGGLKLFFSLLLFRSGRILYLCFMILLVESWVCFGVEVILLGLGLFFVFYFFFFCFDVIGIGRFLYLLFNFW